MYQRLRRRRSLEEEIVADASSLVFSPGCFRQRFERIGCCSLTICRVENQRCRRKADRKGCTVPPMTNLIASTDIQLELIEKLIEASFEERHNAKYSNSH
jgi:hypothetical protein